MTFILLTIAGLGSVTGFGKVGGYVGLATAVAACHASFAGVTNATWGRVLLPVGPLSATTQHIDDVSGRTADEPAVGQ